MNDKQEPALAPSWRTTWPIAVIALGAFVAIWGGWVGLGELTGFGPIRLLPGIADDFVINSAITLPLGLEAYAALALRSWLIPAPGVDETARAFAQWSAIGSLVLGALGQVAFHLMVAGGLTVAPWQITAAVACLPVLVLGFGAALIHLIHRGRTARPTTAQPGPEVPDDEDFGVWTVADEIARIKAGGGSGDQEANRRELRRLEYLQRRELPDRVPFVNTEDVGAIIADLQAGAGRPTPTGQAAPRCSRDDICSMYRIGSPKADKAVKYLCWGRATQADEQAAAGGAAA